MPYDLAESWSLCSLEARSWEYRLSGLFPRFSESPAYVRLEDDRGNVLEHVATEGTDAERPMLEFDVSLPVNLPVGRTEINLELHVPDDASSRAGHARFELLGHPTRKYLGGSLFPLGCLQTQEPEKFTAANWDMSYRGHLRHAARVIEAIYANVNDAVAIAEEIGLEDDSYASLPCDARAGSGVVVHRSPKRIMVFVAGTTTSAQRLTQAGQMLNGPSTYLQYDTMPFWRDAANVVFPVMTAANVDQQTPIVLCGHSMGGAIVCVMAALLRLAAPHRRIEVLTFGCPKPGGVLMDAMLARGRQRHVRNQGDMICRTCPHPDDVGYLSHLIPEPIYTKIQGWRTPARGCVTLRTDGELVEGSDNGVRLAQFAAAIAPWVAGGAIAFGAEHAISEYVRRLELL